MAKDAHRPLLLEFQDSLRVKRTQPLGEVEIAKVLDHAAPRGHRARKQLTDHRMQLLFRALTRPSMTFLSKETSASLRPCWNQPGSGNASTPARRSG